MNTYFAPLRRQRDYEAAVAKLFELEREDELSSDDDPSEEREREIETLTKLTEDYEEREAIQDDDEDFELMESLPGAEPVTLVRFLVSNGNAITLLREAYGGEVFVVEETNGSEDFLLNSQVAPAELFARLASKSSPVPRALMRLDRIGILADREVVDTLEQEMEVDGRQLGLAPGPAAAQQAGSCQLGSAGASYFQTHHCNTLGGYGYGKSERYCYPQGSEWIQKTTSKARRTTYSRMRGCGSGTCRTRHYYKTVSGWHTQWISSITAPNGTTVSTYKKGIKRKRRVRFEAVGSGFVRGWVAFHDQVADVSF